MGYYDDPKNVDQYEKMCKDYDGSQLYNVLEKHLTPNAKILELGTGPCHDLSFLSQKYTVVASDLSEEFIKRGKQKYPSVAFLQLDAVTLQTELLFDCVFSNKVLHHLTLQQLELSFQRQQSILNPKGLFAHTFWLGDEEMTMHDTYFLYHKTDCNGFCVR